MFLLLSFLSFKFEASFSNDWGVLGFEVPDLPSDFGSNSNPMASWVEGKAVDGGTSNMGTSRFFDITEVEDKNSLIFSSGNNEVSSGGDGDSIDVGIMNLDAVLDVEGLVIPDFKISVPSN